MSPPRRVKMKGSSTWTRLITQQVLDYKEHKAKMCKVWQIKPHHAKSLAWGKEPE